MSNDPRRSTVGMTDTPRCGARTRAGEICPCPPMPNGRCRAHGGGSPGAPRGKANGRFKDGYWTRESVADRRFIRAILKGNLKLEPES